MESKADLLSISHVTIFGVVTRVHYQHLIRCIEENYPHIFDLLDIEEDFVPASNWVTFELMEEKFENEKSKIDFIRGFPKYFQVDHDIFPVKFGNFIDENDDSLITLEDEYRDEYNCEISKQKIFRIPPKQQNLLHLQFEKKGILVWINEFIKGPSDNLTQINIKQMVNKMKSRFIFILILFIICRVFTIINNHN